MPIGERIARCFHCGRDYVCGDCVTNTCPECDQAGHRGLSWDCALCREAERRRRAEIERIRAGLHYEPHQGSGASA